MNIKLEPLLKKHERIKRRGATDAKFNFVEAWNGANELMEVILEGYGKRPEFIAMARNLWAVHIVTAYEVYLKEIIAMNSWDREGYKKILDNIENLSATIVYQVFVGKKVTREFMIANVKPFTSFKNIEDVISPLIGKRKSFKEELGNLKAVGKFEFPDLKSLSELFPDWKETFGLIFTMRNEYLHEGVTTKLTQSRFDEIYRVSWVLQLVMEEYFNRIGKITHKARKRRRMENYELDILYGE
jgi:hypothetical protein